MGWRSRRLLVGVVTASLAAGVSRADGLSVVVVHIDGTRVSGQWRGSTDGTSIEILTAEGSRLFSIDDLVSVSFYGAQSPVVSHASVFYLADGGRLGGDLLRGIGDAVVARTRLADETMLRFDHLAGIRLVDDPELKRAKELFDAALADRLPGKDVLITREEEQVRVVRGRLERLDTKEGTFAFGNRLRTFRTERIYGVVFAAGALERVVPPLTVLLGDGSQVSGRLLGARGDTLRVETSIDATVDFALSNVVGLTLRSRRLVYLTDLTPVDEKTEGQLHRAWRVRKDRSVTGRAMSIAGRSFERGLGVHSRTEITYELGGSYEALAATIGIDDAVRPRGDVVFRVLGDQGVLFDSGPVTGMDPPRDIVVDLAGVSRLTLLVDYGAGLDLSDHADWGGVRLLKTRGKR